MFSNWTIARKIHGVIAVGLVSLCAIGGLAYTTTGQLIRNAAWVTHTHEVLEANNEILSLLKDAETGQRGYLITGEQQYLEPFNQSKGSIRSTMERIKRLTADNPAQQARLAELEGLIGEKFNELQDTIDLRTNTGFDAARDVVLTDKGKQVMDNIRKKLAEVERDERTLLQQRSDEAHKSASTTQAVTLWGTLACLALSSSLAFFVIRGVTNVLLRSVKELTSGAEQLSGAAAQVSSASQALAQGSSEQAASLEETSASTEQINSMARRNSESSRSAADLVLASQQKFTETSRSLEQMVAAMEEINASSGRISMIIKTIDEIAFQTNILALNAAVESARAGEAGMGFAVVADEVRNLAQRCAQAAKDTAGLIEESIAKSNDGKKKVDQVAEAIRVMTQSSAQIKTLVDDVNLGSHEQAQGIEQVARAIAQMEQVTQNTAETAEESASAAEELTAQSETLRTIVASLNTLIDGADSAEHRIAQSAATR